MNKKQHPKPARNQRSKSDSNKKAEPDAGPKKRGWRRKLVYAVLGLVAIWLIGDFAYSRYVAAKIAKWESNVSRDQDGIREGCAAFTYGNGPTAVLFIHGFNETPQIWYRLAPRLAENDFTCRAMRLPGFGETIDNYGKSDVDDWRAELKREIESLQQSHSMIVVCAHSLGGALIINHLLDEPNCIDGVVLLAPAIETASVRSPFLTTRFWHEFSKYTLPFSRVAMSPFEYDAKDPRERALKLRNKFSPRTVVNNMYLLIDENRDRASELAVPARFFVSPDDQVIDTGSIREYYDQWGHKNKKIFEAKNSGHAIPVDQDWQTVADEIQSFANELANPSG